MQTQPDRAPRQLDLRSASPATAARKHAVVLTPEERHMLELIASSRDTSPLNAVHARILLESDTNGPGLTDAAISERLEVGLVTIFRVRKRFSRLGVAAVLDRRALSASKRALNREQEARLLALSRSSPPKGHRRWSLRLLAHKMVEDGHADSLSHEAVRQALRRYRQPSPR